MYIIYSIKNVQYNILI